MYFAGTLPPSKETIKGNIKTITEYKIDDDGKKVKVNLHLSRCLCTGLSNSARHTRHFCSVPCLLFINFVCIPLDYPYFQDRNKESFQSCCKEKGLNLVFEVFLFTLSKTLTKIRLVVFFVFFSQNWKKFGNSEFDAPGPNVATTTVSDDVFMTFISSKEVGNNLGDFFHCVAWKATFTSMLNLK